MDALSSPKGHRPRAPGRKRRNLGDYGPGFVRLCGAAIFSETGSLATQAALVLHVYRLNGGSSFYLGWVVVAALAPAVLLAGMGGVLAERYDERRIMIATDLIRLVAVLAVALTKSVWGVIALQAIISGASALFEPARQSIVPGLLPRERIEAANAWLGSAKSLIHALGPALGAWSYAALGLSAVVIFDAASYALSALLIVGIRATRTVDTSSPRPRRPSWSAELREGVAYLWRRADFRVLVGLTLVAGLAMGLVIPLLRPFVTERLSGDDQVYSHLLTAFGLGGLVGPWLGLRLGRRWGLEAVIGLGFAIEATLMSIWTQVETGWISMVLMFGWGVAVFALVPCQNSYVHLHVDRRYQGRVFGLLEQAMTAALLTGAIAVIGLGDRISSVELLTAAALTYVLAVVASARSRGMQTLRAPPKPMHGGPVFEPGDS